MFQSAGLAKIAETLSSPNYGSYVVGNGISLVGNWMQRIAVGWLAWELTGSPLWLGIIAFADLFPAVLIGPIGGAIADRHNRLRLMQITQGFSCLQAATLFTLSVSGQMDIHYLVWLSLFLGIVTALNQPARLALIPSLIEPRNLHSAIAINSVIFNLARFIGPAIAGVFIASGLVSWLFALNAFSFMIFLITLLRLQLNVPAAPPRKRKSFSADLMDGIAYAARDKNISVQLLLLLIIGLGARPLVELLPGISSAVFSGGPQTLALLTSSFGAGAILGGLWLAGRNSKHDLFGIVIAASFILAAALLVFVSASSLMVAVPGVLVLGLSMVITGSGIQTLLQLNVDAEMRGRVLSLYGLIMRGGPAIGALTMGWVAESVGLRWPLAGGAVLVALAALAITAHGKRQ
jgi:predicted MFS family arabinose efflux permease